MGRIARNHREHFFLKANQLPDKLPAWEYHLHTHHTDGQMSVRAALDRALEIDLTRLVFTEHTEPWRAQSPNWFNKYTTEIQAERERVGDQLEILIGLEAPAIDFECGLELTDEMEQKAEFILGTAHRYPGIEGRVRDLSHNQAMELEFRTLMALTRNPRVDAIAHIGATCQTYCGPFPMNCVETIIREAVAHDVAIELNSCYHKPMSSYLSLCQKHGAWIIPGSDAHSINEIGQAIKMLEECV